MIYCFDLDGTICSPVPNSKYELAVPDQTVINEIKRLYERGHTILIMTARGCVSKIDHTELTMNQLDAWGVHYHELIMHAKPQAHLFIDDKGIHIDEWKKQIPQIRGIIAGAFDLIHPGFIRMFRDCKLNCTHLTVALQEDPSSAHPGKPKPVHNVEERKEILKSIKYVDEVVVYQSEEALRHYLGSRDYDVRFLGENYKSGSYTGSDIPIEIVFIDRSHNYSTTELKRKITKSWR